MAFDLRQGSFFDDDLVIASPNDLTPDLSLYDRFIVAFSGGKDSLACLLMLLDMGVPRHAIELWHHSIDGNSEPFMDWPITASYCETVAKAIGVPLYFSWRIGGFR